MTELEYFKQQMDTLIARLQRLDEGESCSELTSGGTAIGSEAVLPELEEIQRTAEALKKNLERVRHRGQLDPEVRSLESQLDEALNRYYYLWHKCKERTIHHEH